MYRIVKPFLLVFMMLACASVVGQNRWGSPFTFGGTYHGSHFYNSFFLGSGSGWVFGGAVSILHTTDKGESWLPQIQPSNQGINNVYFISDSIGWGVGNNGLIVHTTDAGSSWSPQSINTTQPLYSVFFRNQDSGWVAGNNVLASTINGGQTWQKTTTTIANPGKIIMLPSGRGWILSSGTLFETIDTGKTWNTLYLAPSASPRDIFFLDNTHGWVVTYTRKVFKTTNGGQTWQSYNFPSTSPSTAPERVQFSTPTKGWALAAPSSTSGGNHRIFETSDGGATWNQIYSTSETINSFYLKDNDFGAIFGLDGFMALSNDGGLTWYNRTDKFPAYLQDVFFVNSNHGWLAAHNYLFKTANGGLDWQQIHNSTNTIFNTVFFTSESIGYALCDNYTGGYTNKQILKTLDGGITWQVLFDTASTASGGNQFNLGDVFFVNDSVGWVSGIKNGWLNGWLRKTTDGGITWVEQTTTSNYGVYRLDFVSPLEGWFFDSDDEIFKTSNGGTTWTKVSSLTGTINKLRDMDFVTPTQGWVAASSGFAAGPGTIFYTSNGGQSWTAQITSNTNSFFNTLCFLNTSLGFATGAGSNMYMTTDGGQTWSIQNSTLNSYGMVRAIPPASAVAIDFYRSVVLYSCSAFIQKTENENRCDAGQLSLNAVASSGLPTWYDSPMSIVPIHIGTNFTTPHLLTSKAYWVEANAQGCVSQRKKVTATIMLENNTIFQSWDSLVSQATGVTYQWLNCDSQQIIQGETTNKFMPTTNGSYAVIISDGICVDTSDCFHVNNIGLIDREKTIYSIQPNPVNDKVTISSTMEMQDISIFDTSGKCLMTILPQENKNNVVINLSGFKSGLYVVKIKSLYDFYAKTLIKRN